MSMPPIFGGNGRHAQPDSVRTINQADTDWGGNSGSSCCGRVRVFWTCDQPTSFGQAIHPYHEIGGIGNASALAGRRVAFVVSQCGERAGYLARRGRARYERLQGCERFVIAFCPSVVCGGFVIPPTSLSPSSAQLFSFYRTCENVKCLQL